MKIPELLCPAGDFERLRYALAYGADAVYLAGKQFGMRAASGNFTEEELRQAASLAHSLGKRVFVAVNAMPRNDEMDRLPAYLEVVGQSGADAVIAADIGVMKLCQKYAPQTEIHISTQANITNYQAARAWHELGAKRAVLARELSLEEIACIRAKTPPELELEVFVHGAMCMSYSGRCYLSDYLTGRDANRGACAQPCRWQYSLVEQKRPGQPMDVVEGAEGSYLLNSKDLCMIDHIPALVQVGVDSLKIEGRMKTAYYTGGLWISTRKTRRITACPIGCGRRWKRPATGNIIPAFSLAGRTASIGRTEDISGPGIFAPWRWESGARGGLCSASGINFLWETSWSSSIQRGRPRLLRWKACLIRRGTPWKAPLIPVRRWFCLS